KAQLVPARAVGVAHRDAAGEALVVAGAAPADVHRAAGGRHSRGHMALAEVVGVRPFLAGADGEALHVHPDVPTAGDPGAGVLCIGGDGGDEAGAVAALVLVRRGDLVLSGRARVGRPGTVVHTAVLGDPHIQVDVLLGDVAAVGGVGDGV